MNNITLFILLLESAWFLAIVWADCDNAKDSIVPYQPKNPQLDIQTVVQEHNKYRQLVAQGEAVGADGNLPRATNMGTLKWNDDLALKAQELANRCIFEHVIPTVNGFDRVGQNLFEQFSTAQGSNECNYTGAIDSWFNEIKDYVNSQREPFVFTDPTGHLTQIVWANTMDVGCACTNIIGKNDDMRYKQIVVCNYGPAGNVLGGEMYKIAS